MKQRSKTLSQTMSRDPQEVTSDLWYYEYPTHLLFVMRHFEKIRSGGIERMRYIGTTQTKVPWRKLMASARRCQRMGEDK